MIFCKLEISIPKIVAARDCENFDFRDYKHFLNELGLTNITVTELGFIKGEYLGLVHYDVDAKEKSFKDMKKDLRNLANEGVPFDSILDQYYNKGCK